MSVRETTARRPAARSERAVRAAGRRDGAPAVPTVRDFMTPRPFTVGRDLTLAVAHEIMRARRIRHLPVLHGGELVGIVSQRDLHLVETLRDVDPYRVSVGEAMTEDVLVVGPGAHLDVVADKMAARRCGSAVVVEAGEVVGLFTTIDALRALRLLLRDRG